MKNLRKGTEKIRQSLLMAASEIFAQKGYRDTTIAEISANRPAQTSRLSITTSAIKKPFMSKHGDVPFMNL